MAEEVQSRENPVFGRKIFFINASFLIKEVVKNRIREREYEAYFIENWRDAKTVLAANPGSICLINLDHVNKDSLTVVQYLNFILSCEKDEKVSSTYFGVMSSNTSPRQMNLFFFNTQLPAGYVPVSPNKDDLTETLTAILDINGAMGRRKFIRASCDVSGSMYIKFNFNGSEVALPLVDFSSVGIACRIPEKQIESFPDNTLLSNVSLYLYGETLKISLVVLKHFERNGEYSLITILGKDTLPETRKTIRNYVFRVLENKVDGQIAAGKPDETEYSDKIGKKMIVDMDSLPASEEDTEVPTLDLEEI